MKSSIMIFKYYALKATALSLKSIFPGCFIVTLMILFLHNPLNGQSWTSLNTGIANSLTSITFKDVNTGWSVGQSGMVINTTDGGQSWVEQPTGVNKILNGVSFPDANNGWAVGNNGTIIHTADGGANWNTQAGGTASHLISVFFIDVNTGWVTSNNGQILHTTDGGTNWNLQVSGTGNHLARTQFIDVNTGWIVGNGGVILNTTNGGAAWNIQVSGTGNHLTDLHFTDANNGWIVGNSGTILHTINGGANWNPQVSGTGNGLTGIDFVDASTGWIVGDGGTVLSTTNGGTTWSPEASGTAANLTEVAFMNSFSGWAAGDGGKILRYNQAPVLTAIGNRNIDENQALSITLSASDANGDVLTYDAVNLPSGAAFNDSTFTWTPGFSQSGSYNVTFRASDGALADSEIVTITVNNASQSPPVLSAIGPQSVDENQLLSIILSASDADGDLLTYSVPTMPSGASITDSIFTWTPGFNQAGSYGVVFSVSDGMEADSETVAITVNNVSRPPVLSPIGAKNVSEDSVLSFWVSAQEGDGNPVTISAVNLPPGATFTDNAFTWKPSFDQAGSYYVTFRASVGVLADSENVLIMVYDNSRAPIITSEPVRNGFKNGAYTYDVNAHDPDGNNLTYSFGQAPFGMAINSSSGMITWTPQDTGGFSIVIEVSDGISKTVQAFGLNIEEDAGETGAPATDNRPPVLESMEDVSAVRGELLEITVTAQDEDGNTLGYSLEDAPAGMAIDSIRGMITWTPGVKGVFEVVVNVSDGVLAAAESFVVIIANTPPVFHPIDAAEVNENEPLSISLRAQDIDGDSLRFSIVDLPRGSQFENGIFIWTPDFKQGGSYTALFIVSDGTDADSSMAVITVNNTNRAPEITSTPAGIGFMDSLYQSSVTGKDDDGDNLIYSLSTKPEGMVIDSLSGEIRWMPSSPGTHDVTALVNDGEATAALQWEIMVAGLQSGPSMNAVEEQRIDEGGLLSIILSAAHNEGDTLLFSVMNMPEGAALERNIFSWTPSYTQAGEYRITAVVSDGAASDSLIMVITVKNVNSEPVILSKPLLTGKFNGNYSYRIEAEDADKDTLLYSLQTAPNGMRIDPRTGEINWQASEDGIFEVDAQVSDGNSTITQSWEITVRSINIEYIESMVGSPVVNNNDSLVIELPKICMKGDSLCYSIITIPPGMKIEGNHITWIPGQRHRGYYEIVLEISGPWGKKNITIPIVINQREDSLLTIPDNRLIFAEDSTLSVNLENYLRNQYAIGELKFRTVSGDKLEVTMDSLHNEISITPLEDWFGEEHIIIYAQNDSLYYFDIDTVDVSVMAVNDPPGTFELLHPCENTEEIDSLILWTSAYNADPGDSITYSLLFTDDDSRDTVFSVRDLMDTVYVLERSVTKQLVSGRNYKIELYAEDRFGLQTTADKNISGIPYRDARSGPEYAVPTEYLLCQNYPNPFNPVTHIRFSLPVGGNVTAKIYNLLGQEIAVLVNNHMPAGEHIIQWNGLNQGGLPVSSGIYIYTIRAGTFVSSKKMTFAK